ncbi:MAG: hypothetical protein M9887_11445 [Chitinophagales bacterium]|nr:hypothetical protein [Chitinophagales bacterium]
MINQSVLLFKRYSTFFLLTVLLLVSTLFWGKFWGWMDDMFLFSIFSGFLYKEPTNIGMGYLMLSSDLIVLLYKLFPLYNWYSIFLNSTLIISIYLTMRVISTKIREANFSNLFYLLFIVFFYFAFLSEFYLYITFTQVCAVGSVSAGLYFLTQTTHKKYWILFYLSIVSLIRYEVVIPTLPFYLPFFLYRKYRYRTIQLMLVHSFLLIVFVSSLVKLSLTNEEWTLNALMVEAVNSKANSMYEKLDSNSVQYAKFYSLKTMFTGDLKMQMTDDVKEIIKVKKTDYLQISNLLDKLKFEYNRASNSFTSEYMPSRNWSFKAMICLIFLFMISAILMKSYNRIIIYLICVFVFTLIAVTIFYKMEYRAFSVFFLTILLIILTLVEKRSLYKVIVLCFIFSMLYSAYKIKEFSGNKPYLISEKEHKQRIMSELDDKFNNKFIFFDLASMGILYPGWVRNNIHNNKSNTFIVFGEMGSNLYKSHLKYLESICGSSNVLPFFKCLYYNRDNVIFAFSDMRIAMYELYFDKVYNWHIKFKQLEDSANEINTIKYSYNSFPISLDYYVFENE